MGYWSRRFELFIAGLLALGQILGANAIAQPKPDATAQELLNSKQLTYEDWLLYDGIYKKDPEQVGAALARGADANTARDFRRP